MQGTAAVDKQELQQALRILSSGIAGGRVTKGRTAIHLLTTADSLRLAAVGTISSSSAEIKATLVTGHIDASLPLAYLRSIVRSLRSDTVRISQDEGTTNVEIADHKRSVRFTP